MRYSSEHKERTRERILTAAGHLFRTEGYGGAGIDGLTKSAGVTNGAFYGHFATKADAFRAAVRAGLAELREGIALTRSKAGSGWLSRFAEFYLGAKRTCDLGEACAVPTLSADVARADLETRAVYEAELRQVLGELAKGMPGESDAQRDDEAIALLAMLAGGAILARAVADPRFSEHIADVVRGRVLASDRAL